MLLGAGHLLRPAPFIHQSSGRGFIASSMGNIARVMRPRDLVGDTPLVELARLFDHPRHPRVVAKLERRNPGGSAKDRPAEAMIARALADGSIQTGTTLIESSSGNLGVSLAQQARWHGLRFICVVDPRINRATRALIEAYGAEVVCVERPDPVSGDWLAARIAAVEQLVAEIPGAYWPQQYANPANPRAHADGTMREIAEALDGDLDALYVATSTTGTLRGCLDYVKDHGMSTRVIAVDAVGSRLFGGVAAPRILPGFGAGVEPALARDAVPDSVVRISGLDAVKGCRRLVDREGLLAGASGGAVVSAVLGDVSRYRADETVAMILHDGGEAYLDTVYDDAWVCSAFDCSAADLHDAPPNHALTP